ncbi:NAD(P)/FAD-dependent oxidoreductase [Variovorax sp. 770b2]|uniref:flavin-containing monooxygenase n=1 Tax=Variovorax sp. 770b2 TaxID=1566271 RepID=UPI0008EE0B38|nr:NAD(P)/FAD-dependent oxidoreductase [Variovorax sp. 770b2]SFP38649.1 putative flavoprotein involved in K+ transport [Variovorax sp. 770b2]
MTTTTTTEAHDWLARFGDALARRDIKGACALFEPQQCFWRDLVAFSWNIVTCESQEAIREMLAATLAHTQPSAWTIEGSPETQAGMLTASFRFETATGRGQGLLRLREGRCWTLLTVLDELKGFEEKSRHRRVKGAEHGADTARVTWLEKRQREEAALGHTEQPYCLVVGGGQGGIALGARLKRLGVPTLVIERHARAGDTWRSRYKSLCLHDPVWYDHLPYMPFPDDWPVFTPKDKLGDWLEAYTRIMELDYWGSTLCRKARYDEATQTWEVEVEREGRTLVLRPKQLVFALGVAGYPVVPAIAGAQGFEGEQHHSSQHPGGEAYRGKKVVVLGANNSAHDICADLWEHGADVTMVQRSSTLIARSDTLMDLFFGGLYSEKAVDAGITTAKADLIAASVPNRVAPWLNIPLTEAMAERDKDFYQRLEAAGFMLDFGEDGSGLGMKYMRRASGYYIDVGASELIADGRIKLRSRTSIEQVKPRSVVLADGSELPADVIVYATGYGSMNSWLADLVSPEVADRVGKCWGLGSDTTNDPGPWEGELRNMWKPTQQPGLWIHGGNLSQSRFYSLTLALQIKARMEGLATPVHALQPVHHTR